MNEKIAHRFAEKYPKTKVVGLRFFNIYGAWQGFSGGYASVIPKWIHCLMTDQQPILYGDGTATRDFCFVDEISKIILGIPLKPESVRSTIYNIGAGQPIELLHLFSVISHVIQLKGKYIKFSAPKFLEPRKGDILHSLADISRARNELGFTPSIKLESESRKYWTTNILHWRSVNLDDNAPLSAVKSLIKKREMGFSDYLL